MFKLLKHIFFVITASALVGSFLSCKSKKEAQKDVVKGSAQQNEIKFTSMFIDGCAALQPYKQNLDEALRLFLECKKIDPNSAPLKYELAKTYKLKGAYNLAIQYAKGCAEGNPKNEWYQLLLIECYASVKDFNQSIKLREQLVKNFPGKAEFKEDLAIEYSIVGDYDKSYKIYDELELVYGINEQITLNKCKLLKNQKKFKEAEQELIRLSNSSKNEPRYFAYLADFYMEQNKLDQAKLMYDKILVLDPNNPSINLALHDYYSAQGKDDEAFDYLKKAFQNPDLEVNYKLDAVRYYYLRAEKQPESTYYTRGMELSDLLVRVHPKDSRGNAIHGDFLMLVGKIKEASDYYYNAAINESIDFRAWGQLLFIDSELKQYDSLERHSALAMELFPSQSSTYFFNGVANMQIKNYKKAAQSLKDGLEFVVDNKALMMDFYSNMGDAYFYMKDYVKSDKAFDNALKIDADNTYVLNNYAYYLSLRNESLDKAEKLSKKANEIIPNNRNYMDTYGWILYQQKKYKESETWLKSAAKMGPPKADILEHYGDLLYRLNKVDEAVVQWNLAKQAGGNSEALLTKLKLKKLND
ncbi:MAG: tetratricopeptide repeat protein [Bacteroidota bacterium]|nr:tetratricopeptide repeat protein [Bacteroidota bacterium]MDP3146898.1 tetratricopeptide repeat protein [Bacteroidota bacterium]